MSAPKVFISYSQHSEEHKAWVLQLAKDLVGIDVQLDRMHLTPGRDVVDFTTRGIREANRVILVCSYEYVRKADHASSGGVAQEWQVIAAELAANLKTNKFIPILRDNAVGATPSQLGLKLHIDFRDDAAYRQRLAELLDELLGTLPSAAAVPANAQPRPPEERARNTINTITNYSNSIGTVINGDGVTINYGNNSSGSKS